MLLLILACLSKVLLEEDDLPTAIVSDESEVEPYLVNVLIKKTEAKWYFGCQGTLIENGWILMSSSCFDLTPMKSQNIQSIGYLGQNSKPIRPGDKCKAFLWGSVDPNATYFSMIPTKLEVTILDPENCTKSCGLFNMKYDMCGDIPKNGETVLFPDIGSPLVCQSQQYDNKLITVGVLNSERTCSDPYNNTIANFWQVSKVDWWIDDVVTGKIEMRHIKCILFIILVFIGVIMLNDVCKSLKDEYQTIDTISVNEEVTNIK
ncbi:MAG: Chymase [Paramarteilia canceri]